MAVSRIDEAGLNVTQYGNRNLIINGNFTVSQRGDYTSSTSVSDGNYYLDRWEYVEDGSPTASLIQNTDGSVKITTGASVTGSSRLRQKFEYDKFPRQYDNKTFTVSVKVKSNSANARINVYAGGYLSLTGTTAHSGGGNYETLTATFTTPTTITTEFSVHIGIDGPSSSNVSISSGDYFEAKEIQMELGDTATGFEHRSYGDELQRCRRYFEVNAENMEVLGSPGAVYSSTAAYGPWQFQVEKRVNPTVGRWQGAASDYRLRTNGNNFNCTTLNLTNSSTYACRWDANVASGLTGGQGIWLSTLNTPTQFYADAEL